MSPTHRSSTLTASPPVLGDPPSRTNEDLLVVEGLCTTFSTPRGPLRAVDGVSLTLGVGETLGIVGESGSGKSVLVRSIMDLLPPSTQLEGQVLFGGESVAGRGRTQRAHFWGPEIAMIFQNPMTSLNPVRSIERQITDPLRYHLGLSRRQARQRALELLDMVSIPDAPQRLKQYPHELSGGMRQRVMIAIALSCQPRLLIADEPTTALDVTVQRQVLDLLSDLQQARGMAMILISHDLGVVAGRTERLAVMYAGTLVEVAATRAIFSARRHPYTAALLDSIPRVDQPRVERLPAIEGSPPGMIGVHRGCPFQPRCKRAHDRCETERPALEAVEPGHNDHQVACFAALDEIPVAATTIADQRSR